MHGGESAEAQPEAPLEQWERDLSEFSLEDHLSRIDRRISAAHLKYAKFVARRDYI